ncbi:MAG: hypothetical protein HY211_00770 [Candidatus Omnitrophica bacterium]|nr:hypothetical protein [Candidatus Omnitrophota bacterium]
MRRVRIRWDGPIPVEDVLRLNDNNDNSDDYGLYQIYGQQIVYGSGVLLYIGKAEAQTFGGRFRQHVKEWLNHEEGVFVRIGRIASEDYAHEPPDWPDWKRLLADVEALEIYRHSPSYNSKSICEYAGQPLHLINEGDRGSLVAECMSDQLQSKPKDENEAVCL